MEINADLSELEDLNALFEEFRKVVRRDPKTMQGYKSRFRRFQEFLKNKRGTPLFLANAEDIAAYDEELSSGASQVSYDVKTAYINSLRRLYAFLIKKGLYEGENPYKVFKAHLNEIDIENARYNDKMNSARSPPKDKFSDEEIEVLIDAAKKHKRTPYLSLAIDIAVNTGIRIDGISKLTLDKIKQDDLSGKYYIQLTKGLIHEENDVKTHSQRVPFPDTLYERINDFVSKRNEQYKRLAERGSKPQRSLPPEYERHVFISKYRVPILGNKISNRFLNLMREVLPQSEIDRRNLSFHSLRKSFASRMLKAGFKLHEVSKMLGHTRITTTVRYLKMDEQEVMNAYAEKEKEQSLDFMEKVETQKKIRKVQVQEQDIFEQQKEIDLEYREVANSILAGSTHSEKLFIRLFQLVEEKINLRNQLVSPREQQLLEEREILLRKNAQLEEELRFAQDRMKELPNFKFYERKTKKSLKERMKERAFALRDDGLGYGKIADTINEEYNTTFTRQTIRYWIENRESS